MRVERLPAVLAFQCGVATRGLMPGIRIRNVCFYCFPNAAMEEWFPTENALRVPRAPSPQLSAFFSVSSLKSSCYTCLIYRSIKEPNNRTYWKNPFYDYDIHSWMLSLQSFWFVLVIEFIQLLIRFSSNRKLIHGHIFCTFIIDNNGIKLEKMPS